MRNAEVIRQWNILLRIDAARTGVSVDDLASEMRVTKRTIWRDLDALQQAGFPLVDEKRDRRTYWRLAAMPLRAVSESGLSLTEVCSLYMSRALVAAFAGSPFATGLASVFKKLERALSPKMRRFLDELPGVIKVKTGPLKKRTAADFDDMVGRLLEASLSRRAARIRYFSASSNREKEYAVHPLNIAYADGGLYLTAHVPEYRQVRTFALERVRKVALTEHRFEVPALAGDPFGHSLGVNSGRPERIELEFAARIAPYIHEREWHSSQRLTALPDGRVRLTLRVSRDYALRSWILGFGPLVRVVSPASLAGEILEHLELARDAYAPKLQFEIVETPRRELPLFRAH